MRAAVIVFPGSNADTELIHTLRDVIGITTDVVWHKDHELPSAVDLVAIPGGFAHGDYLRPGAIAKASPIVPAIVRHGERGGLVLGICNGFQVLTEIGLLPGALVRNEHLRFECSDCFLRVAANGPFTSGYDGVLRLPVAHAEGRYHADADTLSELEREDCIAFYYSDRNGKITEAANINGSRESIAGVYNRGRNVLGLMPHPERASEALLGSDDGRKIFDSAARWYAEHEGLA